MIIGNHLTEITAGKTLHVSVLVQNMTLYMYRLHIKLIYLQTGQPQLQYCMSALCSSFLCVMKSIFV